MLEGGQFWQEGSVVRNAVFRRGQCYEEGSVGR